MCGATSGFSNSKCNECGETRTSNDVNLPVSYDDFQVYNARNAVSYTGVMFFMLGLLLSLSGGTILARKLLESDFIISRLNVGFVVVGLCYGAGGVLIYLRKSLGFWIVQPINLALLVVFSYWITTYSFLWLNMLMLVVLAIFAQRCHRLIPVALKSYESDTEGR